MILSLLRKETGIQHAELERRLPLMAPDLSRVAYAGLVQRFYGYYAPLEALFLKLPWWTQMGFNYDQRRKTSRLVQDVLALGETLDGLARLPLCDELPELDSPQHLLGCLYVIEGATLGGMIITRHLESLFGLTSESGSAFFTGYGEHTVTHWRAFGALLTDTVQRHGSEEIVIRAANQTFDTMSRWLFPVQGSNAFESSL